jgi:hypothetical protein
MMGIKESIKRKIDEKNKVGGFRTHDKSGGGESRVLV